MLELAAVMIVAQVTAASATENSWTWSPPVGRIGACMFHICVHCNSNDPNCKLILVVSRRLHFGKQGQQLLGKPEAAHPKTAIALK